MFTLLKLPFKIIGALIKLVFRLLGAILLPAGTLGGVAYFGYNYLKSNPETAERIKNAALGAIKGKKK